MSWGWLLRSQHQSKGSIFDTFSGHIDVSHNQTFPSKLMDVINEERAHLNKTVVDGETIKENRQVFYIPQKYL